MSTTKRFLLGSTLLNSVLFLAVIGCGSESASTVDSVAEPSDYAVGGLARMIAPNVERGLGFDSALEIEDDNDRHEQIVDHPFKLVQNHPLSTFSIDVDTASYSKVRQHLLEYGRLPRPDAVRIEELLNYFAYDYQPPAERDSHPFASHIAIANAPWNANHRLARIALKGRTIENEDRPPSNLVFLIDTSGSMKQPNKLPLLKRSLGLLLKQLGENDRVAIVAYAGSAGLALDSTPATESNQILNAFAKLQPNGGTNGGQGIALAYQIARQNLINDGTNRILLCTDGDFNVGQTSNDELIATIQKESASGVDLTVLGFGMGNLNDSMLEQISGKGNGNYAFIDSYNEAKKVLAEQVSATLVTIAKEVKIQVEFNPAQVAAYRLIGYENRLMASEDFNDDEKDAGEIGAGHSVTALYEIIPTGTTLDTPIASVDPLKYQTNPTQSDAAASDEWLTLKLRYKLPGEEESRLIEKVASDDGATFDSSDQEFQFAAAVAGFGMLLRESEYKGDWTYDSVSEIAQSAIGKDAHGFRQEFVELVDAAKILAAK